VAGSQGKIVDLETGEALPPGEENTGELCIKGPQVMLGYLDEPEKTRECLTEDGWLHSGDIGYVDEDGYYYIVDRLKELIKYKGFQVAPAELEAVICSFDKVTDCAVIPVVDEQGGEVPRAYVVKGEEGLSEEEVLAFVEERVAPHKKLRGGVVFIDAIPKNPSGKILRRVVIEMDREGAK
jgi:acyl-CoA synthetase (AMP-forming)/AMP-acid ligase II